MSVTTEKTKRRATLTAEAREYVSFIVSMIKQDHPYGAPREFEAAVCSCSPLRQKVEDVKAERDKAVESIDKRIKKLEDQRQEIEKPFQQRIGELNTQIRKLDSKEHPKAETLWRESKNWAKLWAIAKLETGELKGLDPSEIKAKFFNDVALGWRPAPPEAAFT